MCSKNESQFSLTHVDDIKITIKRYNHKTVTTKGNI